MRVVDQDGAQLGIRNLEDALAIAKEQGLDLVEVAENANPPVCRIMDFGKHKYLEAQKAKESRRTATHTVLKEIKYRPKIGRGDFETKTRQVEKFLQEGHRVRVSIMFRGREMQHPELGRKILDEVSQEMRSIAKVDMKPKLDGRNMVMLLVPKQKPTKGEAAAPAGEAPAGEASEKAPTGDVPAGDEPAPAGEVPTEDAPGGEGVPQPEGGEAGNEAGGESP